jgi:SagB-type dehydrogenase family enzyme
MKILDLLSEWRSAKEMSDKLKIDKKGLSKALEHLAKVKMVLKNNIEKDDAHINPRAAWDPIDLALQRQRTFGGRLPMSKRVGKRLEMSPPPIKHVKGLSSDVLTRPHNIRQNKTALLDVLDARKSIRKYGNSYISKDNLSHFLYHSARIKEIFKSDEGTLTKRPYPSGGARYPLEIYVVNNRISSIVKGIHYYDPLKHRLVLINKNKSFQKKFNSFIMNALYPHMKRDSDVVFIITAVFARTMWKYDKIAMSLILSDLGCLYQTMYLVATEMNLAPCPVGGTEEELVKNWLELNWFEESHVGTFLLGKPPSA